MNSWANESREQRKTGRRVSIILAGALLAVSSVAIAQTNGGPRPDEAPQGGSDVPITPGAGWSDTLTVPPAFFWTAGGEPAPADDGPFTFDGSYCVFVTDAFNKGDEFAVYDNGELLGTTSDVAEESSAEGDPNVTYPDPTWSSGVFPVGPGSHSITIEVTANPYDGGRAYIQVDDCPTGAGDNRTTINVTKTFTDGNPEEVEVEISCNTGLPLNQTKVISASEPVEFVITEFDSGELDCEITEVGMTGYDVEYDSGTAVNDESCAYEDLQGGLELNCDITNTPAPVDVVIEKDWVFEGSAGPDGISTEYRLTLWCDAEIVGGYHIYGDSQEAPAGDGPGCGLIKLPVQESGQILVGFHDWCKSFYGSTSDLFEAQVIPEYPDSHCYVEETVYDDAVEVDNGCTDLTVSAGQGTSCTITNTVFYEGIPTLSQYGMAILALLMLGVGFVGFRRFA